MNFLVTVEFSLLKNFRLKNLEGKINIVSMDEKTKVNWKLKPCSLLRKILADFVDSFFQFFVIKSFMVR